MKNLLWLIVLFVLAVALAVGAKFYSGDVYIVIDQLHTQVRLNLHLFIIAVLLLVAVLYVLLKIIAGLIHLPRRWQRWYQNYQYHKVESALNQAGLSYFEGCFQQAQMQAQKVLDNKRAGKNKALALMLAAYSADEANDQQARDGYLQQMAGLPAKQQLARFLLMAKAALSRQDYGGAERALQSAAKINPKLTQLVRLQLRYDFEQQQPLDALRKIDQLSRAGVMGEGEQQNYYGWAYRQLLREAQDSRQFKKCLKSIPADVREGYLGVDIADKYVQLGLYQPALKWIRKIYPRQHEAALLPVFYRAYQSLEVKEQQKAIDIAENWLTQRPHDASLLLLLGQLAYEQQLWGKAQGYLEASLGQVDSVTARLLLAKVLEKTGHVTEAEAQRQHVLSEVSDDEEI
ncbi:heme biosynthesis HemY N-terminal domain-containing protein [Neisseriaceae bacterium ESL0693]|nr:heme biosynthesis HemY N-terminal domain-containing protein [Neisseriaceae bacterium ESL0693]